MKIWDTKTPGILWTTPGLLRDFVTLIYICINQGVRQECNLSPALFNICLDDLLRNWKHKDDPGILLKRNLYLNTLLFADDQVVKQDSEDKLQKSVCILNQMSKGYNLKISMDKTKIMAFKGKQCVPK